MSEEKRKVHSEGYYIFSFISMHIFSFGVAGIIFIFFIMNFFIPNVLNVSNFFDLILIPESLITILLTPGIIILSYLIHLFLVAIVLKLIYNHTEKLEPMKVGIIPREKNSRALKYYHIRSYILRYPKWAFTKSPFPWLAIKLFNFVGTTNYGKGTTLEEQVCGEKYITTGKNCYFGVNGVLTSHLVEGSFGNVQLFPIKIGNNVSLSTFACIPPGTEIGDNVVMFPVSGSAKNEILKSNNYYIGMPVRKLFTKKIKELTKLSEEQIGLKKKLK